MASTKTTQLPCPRCISQQVITEGPKIWMSRIDRDTFLCPKCGSSLTEPQIKSALKRKSEVHTAQVLVNHINTTGSESFGDPVEGDDPPDAESQNSAGDKLLMEVVNFDPEYVAELEKYDFTSGNVNPLKSLLETLMVKVRKNYDPNFRKELILVLEGNIIADDYFRDHEQDFVQPSEAQKMKDLGFKRIWYVSDFKNAAYKIYSP